MSKIGCMEQWMIVMILGDSDMIDIGDVITTVYFVVICLLFSSSSSLIIVFNYFLTVRIERTMMIWSFELH